MSDVAEFVREKLGHEPKDLRLFELALTHSSARRRQLRAARVPRRPRARPGHRAARSTNAIPNEPEGYLSRRYNVLVARETCAEVGRELGVPTLVRLGKQAREDGASQSDNVVGDVVEALIGALLHRRRTRGGRALHPRGLGAAPRRAAQGAAASQVGAPGAGRGARAARRPLYEVVGRTGAHHAPTFTIRVSVPGLGEADRRRHEQAGSGNRGGRSAVEPAAMSETATRAGFVAVIGAPNAGKSTLVNALVGQKVAIVSPKAQTTRARLMGIAIARATRRSCSSTRPASSSRSGGSTGRWSPPPGPAPQDADLILLVIDAAAGVNARGRAHRRRARGAAAAAVPRPQQGRPGQEGRAAGAVGAS